MKENHTPGPLVVSRLAEHSFPAFITDHNGGVLVAKTIGLDVNTDSQDCEIENANARRIVACWNACEGILTEYLEWANLKSVCDDRMFVLRENERLQAQNARLLEALKESLPIVKHFIKNHEFVTIEKMEAEIASIEEPTP